MKKNRYTVALGKFIQIARSLEGLTSKEAAKKLKISESAYRMMEAGWANVQPWHILSLIATFPSTTINYASLSTIISAIETISRSENESCLEVLICAVPGLKVFKNFTGDDSQNGKIIYQIVSSSLDEDQENLFKSFSNSVTKKMQEDFVKIISEGFKEVENALKA